MSKNYVQFGHDPREVIGRMLLVSASALLPENRSGWGTAMLREHACLEAPAEQFHFALGATRGMLSMVLHDAIRGRIADARHVRFALLFGCLGATLDLLAPSRMPYLSLLVITTTVLTLLRPVAAWRWAILVGGMLPLLMVISGNRGPYQHDPGDRWIPVILAVVVTSIVRLLRCLLMRCSKRFVFAVPFTAAIVIGHSRPADAQQVSVDAALFRRQNKSIRVGIEHVVDSAMAPYMHGNPNASAAVVVVVDDTVRLLKGYGRQAQNIEVDPESTMFNIASVSKLFTAVAAMQLVERGTLTLDDDIRRWAGSGVIAGQCAPVTLRHLLTHTSGLDGAFMQEVVRSTDSLEPLASYFRRLPMRCAKRPGVEIRYSNAGMSLVGHLVEVASGESFTRYTASRIFQPLGMRHSTFEQPPPKALIAHVATHGVGLAPNKLILAPSGAMLSSAGDIGRFMRAMLNAGVFEGRRVLASNTVAEMFRIQWRGDTAIPGVGLGFFTSDLERMDGRFHTGSRVHLSLLYLVPERRLGVFVVMGARQGGATQNLRADVVRAVLRWHAEKASVSAATPVESTPRAKNEWPPLRTFAGIYRPSLLATSSIERAAQLFTDSRVSIAADDALALQIPGGPNLRLRRVGATHFRVADGVSAGMHVAFTRSEDGRIKGLMMAGDTQDPVSFVRLAWFQRGLFHLVVIGATAALLVLNVIVVASAAISRRIRRRTTTYTPGEHSLPWRSVLVAGLLTIATPLAVMALVMLGTSEDVPAEGLRRALYVGLTIAMFAVVAAIGSIPLAVTAWRKRYWGRPRRVFYSLLAFGVLVSVPLLLHYHLLGYWI